MSANHRDQTIRTAALKVGFLTVVAIGLLMGVLGWLRGRSLWSGASYTVLFPDVDGLKESAPVQMMGIRVGFVDSVTPEVRHGRYQVRVQFNLGNQSIHIPIGSLLSIQQSGLIGEKFLEITPPEEHHCQLSTSVALQKPLPLWAEYQQGAAIVGQLEAITPNHKGVYRLSRNNLSPANYCYYRQGKWWLTAPQAPLMALAPLTPPPQFIVESPMRMKAFLDIQMETAEALRDTNLKISQLLTDDTITSLSNTVANTEQLTAEATQLLNSAHGLVQASGQDLRHLVVTADALAENLTAVSTNVNNLLANGELQTDVRTTAASIRSASQSLEGLLSDPALKETLSLTQQTARDASQLVSVLNRTAHNPAFNQKLDVTLRNLNTSLDKVNTLLTALEASPNDPANASELSALVQDVKVTAKNTRQLSERLNKRFLLFRLLF